MGEKIYIVATGARTPVGLQAAPAAVRAGISGLGEHPFMIDQEGEPMPGALDAHLDPTITGPRRLLGVAETALREACAPLDFLSTSRQPFPVYLALPEVRPGFSLKDAQEIRSGLTQIEGLPAELQPVGVFTQGHAAGFLALAKSVEQIRQGAFEMCLVGGEDSYFHPDTMEWFDAHRQLTGTVSRSGFIPGEGAGFCLVMADRACRQLGLKPKLCVRAVAVGKEAKLIKTDSICLGEVLTSTVEDAVSSLDPPAEAINTIICDINGERYRGEEWGFVCLRLSDRFDDPTDYLAPADCWGDMGAASGPLFAMLFHQAVERGYAKGPRTMLWASSESGDRGAAVLEAINLAK
jgi:3-oxoacyl-[acyl-carrier-protein] synthase-1